MGETLTMKKDDKEALDLVRKILRPLVLMDKQMTINRFMALLDVIVEEIDDMYDLRDYAEKNYDLSKSGLSRMVSYWGPEAYLQYKNDADGKPTIPVRPEGQNFLEFTPDPRDYRRRMIKVTPKGTQFAEDLAMKIKHHCLTAASSSSSSSSSSSNSE
jgi:hypothetical protein